MKGFIVLAFNKFNKRCRLEENVPIDRRGNYIYKRVYIDDSVKIPMSLIFDTDKLAKYLWELFP